MNGKKCRELRRALQIKKPTPAIGGYGYFDVTVWRWGFIRRINPMMQMYRNLKRHYKRRY
jgi:hypothetical protein